MGKSNSKAEQNRTRSLTKRASFHLTNQSVKLQTDHFLKKYPDGYMSKEEFIGNYFACSCEGDLLLLNSGDRDFWELAFSHFDTNKDGKISVREYLLVFSLLNQGTPAEKFNAAFSIFDVDGDDKITKQEFKLIFGYLEKIQKMKKEEHKKEADYVDDYDTAFTEIDVNKNGTISIEEFKTACEKNTKLSAFMTIWICPHTLVTSDENIYKKALETIGIVMSEVLGPFDTPGLLLGMMYYKIQQDRADRENRLVKEFHYTDLAVSEKEIEEGKFFLEYAEVVYGRYRKLPKLGGFDFTYAEKMSRTEKKMECALKYLKISKEDVITQGNWHPELYKPTYLLFFDHKVQTIGLSICGTKSWNDCLTDLAADVVEFFKGICHSGMAKAAQYLAEILRDDIKAAREKYPKYRIVIAGHSLGAGTAAILTIILRNEGLPVDCFAYAPPPVVSYTLSKESENNIRSFCLQDDVVCRASMAAIIKMRDSLKESIKASQTVALIKEFFGVVVKDNEQKTGALTDSTFDAREQETSLDKAKLFSPGATYHITYDLPSVAAQPVNFGIAHCSRRLFGEIRISSTMVTDHDTFSYREAFQKLTASKKK